ncbi:MAG: hypothetical protein PWP32_1426 [Methanothermobacter sp.]|jgi:uncharacterized protein YutE (UPF0331/DUF86 family)|nr:DUF86 domain-containing protein [Methanothermobacter sp.]MDI6818536.1 DUF86 domain-containing protein [Methanothermobacter thermautotrophicus]MDN5374661.1 hypothetical protein [Methanothermobacter sp.]NLU04483.1 DUF86 domain-containing protein [Methanothermobacter sp.]HOQ18782.1 DUF86 domain-containing protein [Methanothermobacter thermautotrophicus]
MVRKVVVLTKIREIEESVGLIEENLPESFGEFSELGLIRDGMYKRLEFAVENVYDICSILNSDLNLGVPGSDGEVLENLLRSGIIDEDTFKKIKAMRGFRNIVVHRYGKIDDRITFRILQEHLSDFREFTEKIKAILDSLNDEEQDQGMQPSG